MENTLVELPPEGASLEEDSFVDATSTDEIARRTSMSAEEAERIFLPGREVGPYRILGYIASGGMGDVYAAERVMPDGRRLGPVALKIIAPELRGEWQIEERFKREAAVSRAIRSPHVTRAYEFGESDDGYMFMSMELMKGEELFDRLVNLRKLNEKEVGRIMISVLKGLRAVHESGFIHRDLKPENVYFSLTNGGFDETIKILDFGIAKLKDEPSDPFLSVVGKVYGTPEYIAPEQGLNPDVDPRADLYSVGVMMHECLTGVLPFRGETAYATILQHQTEPPPPLPDEVDPELQRIIFRSLQKMPKDRYQSAVEMLADLQSWYVQKYDDELSKSLRESSNLEQPRLRSETPGLATDTPATGVVPLPRRMTRTKARVPGSAPGGPPKSSSPAPPPHAAPPPAAQSGEMPVAKKPTPKAPVATENGEDLLEITPSNNMAGIITMLVVLAVIALVVVFFVL